MYVVCNHDPGPSVLEASDPRCQTVFVSRVNILIPSFRVKSQHPNSLSSGVEEFVRLSKLQQCPCLTRTSRIGGTIPDGLDT